MVGAFAEQICVRPESLRSLPENVDWAAGAAVSIAYETAWHSLRSAAAVQAGEDVVVLGASGGVGSVAISLLNGLGYEVHAVTGRVDEQGDYLRRLGASELVERSSLSEPSRPVARANSPKKVFNYEGDNVKGQPRADAKGGAITPPPASPLSAKTIRTVIRSNIGLAKACYDLGLSRAEGYGVPRDAAGAVEAYAKACDASVAAACNALAGAYVTGAGVPLDPTRAVALFGRA